jgi:hypothetical protein
MVKIVEEQAGGVRNLLKRQTVRLHHAFFGH